MDPKKLITKVNEMDIGKQVIKTKELKAYLKFLLKDKSQNRKEIIELGIQQLLDMLEG